MLTSSLSLPALRGQFLPDESLAKYTSWRVGGPAEYLFIPADLADLQYFMQHIPKDIPLLWLGLGSNVLIRDGGVKGIVIVTQGALHEISQINPQQVRAEAGVACAQIARYTARLGLTGIEFLAGIPGTVGGALKMNAGCYGGETWPQVHSVETINRQGEIKTHPAADFQYTYRHVDVPDNEWFVAAHFILQMGDKETALAKIKTMLEKRNAAQPTGLPNCGSVFRNPPENYAARLIEQSGLKNKRIGGAYVSEKHANFIINDGHATAGDIERLIQEIMIQVEQQQGVRLIPEVCILGAK